MIQTAQATLRIKSFEEIPFSPSDVGPQLIRATFSLTYEGDLQGEGILEETKVRFSEKRAGSTGLMRFTGRVGNFQGSFVLKHTGKFVNGRITATQTVVPGSATDGLKGLRGEVRLESLSSQSFSMTFRYGFA